MKFLVFILVLLGVFYANIRPVRANMEYDATRRELVETAKRVARKDAEARSRARYIVRVKKYSDYLAAHKSPFAGNAADIVDCSTANGINPALMVGILKAESTFGQFYHLANNPWNYGVHLGVTFPDFRTGACFVSGKLKQNYDLTSPLTIGKKYAPAEDHNDPQHWAKVVQGVINELSI